MAKIKTRLSQAPGDSWMPRDTVVFYCKKGRHRSVSLAFLTAQALQQRGYNVTLSHVMRDYWRLGTCNECPACARITDQKKELARKMICKCGDAAPVAAPQRPVPR